MFVLSTGLWGSPSVTRNKSIKSHRLGGAKTEQLSTRWASESLMCKHAKSLIQTATEKSRENH